MTLFWYEIAHFLIAIFGILVALSASALFFLVIRYERQLQTVWRAIGFSALAVTFLLFIFERKYEIVGTPALIVQAFAFISIYIGVFAEPKLSQLLQIGKKSVSADHAAYRNVRATVGGRAAPAPLTVFFLVLVALILVSVFWAPYTRAFLEALAALFVGLTIPIQIRRYQREVDDQKARRLNLYPLLGYIALLAGMVALVFFRLPGTLEIVSLRQLTLEYSWIWQLGQALLALGFVFLGLWAWTFIRVRPFLRTYVVFLSIAIVVASFGSLIFTMLIFGIVERNNLKLMSEGAKTQDLIMQDRATQALAFAIDIGKNPDVLQSLGQHTIAPLRDRIKQYVTDSNASNIRIYDPNGQIIVSSTDERDEGRVIRDDRYLNFTLSQHRQYKTFDLVPGVLTPSVIARALYPILNGQQELLGVVEVDHSFDNAFVDFSQKKTGLDVTIYAGKKRAATTIMTLDGVSRWTGSEESDQAVIDTVLQQGKLYSAALDRLGRPYYSAFEPVKNVNGEIIGMVTVGTPTALLFEETRQQLITTFLIVMLISLLVALLGYVAVRSFGRK